MKLLAAAAWADGELNPEEEKTIRRIGLDLGLEGTEITELDRFLSRPVGLEEAERLAHDLMPRLTREERKAWLDRLEKVIASDSKIDPLEVGLLTGLREAVERAEESGSLIARVRGVFTKERKPDAPGRREEGLLGRILGGIGEESPKTRIDPERLEHATLFGAILCRVAYADGEFSEPEAARLREILTGAFGFDKPEAEQVLTVIESKAAEDLDRQRLCASFNRIAPMGARMRLLGCLFMIAEADGDITDAELREMRLIANYLWIGARDFNKVRMEHWANGGWRAN